MGSGFGFCSVDWSVVKVAALATGFLSFFSGFDDFKLLFYFEFCLSITYELIYCGAVYLGCTVYFYGTLFDSRSNLELYNLLPERAVISAGSDTSESYGMFEFGCRLILGPSVAGALRPRT